MNNEEVIEYLYDPTEGVEGDEDDPLLKIYIEPRQQQQQVEKSDGEEEAGDGLQCQHCGRTFKRQNGLVLHLRTHGNARPRSKSLTCGECHRQFSSRRNLSTHLSSSHSAPGSFSCAECGRSFKRANQC